MAENKYLLTQGNKKDYKYSEYVIDTKEDLSSINVEDTCPGSVAYVVATGEVYMLNNQKEWILQ